jgi:hypothetical protein
VFGFGLVCLFAALVLVLFGTRRLWVWEFLFFFCLCGVVFASCEVGGVRASTVCTLRVDCFHFGADVGGVFACAFGAFEFRLAACLCVTG